MLGWLLDRDYEGDSYGEFTEEERMTIHISGEMIYRCRTMRINYMTYDVMRDGDIIHPKMYPDIMVKSPETGPAAQPYWYARVIGIFHAYVSSTHPDVVGKMLHPMDFLWVRWFGMEPGPYRHGFQHTHLPKIGFVQSLDYYTFTFLDPAQVIRGVHLIPAFSEERTSSLLPVTKSLARILKPDEQDDWVNFYVNMQVNFYFSKRLFVSTLNDGPLCSFLDRDMLMRHFGYGVGHMQYERQQDIGLNMVPGGVDSDDDDDASETEEREEQIDDETEDNEESEPSSDDCSHSSSESDAGGYASL